jgi:hypothetical protein
VTEENLALERVQKACRELILAPAVNATLREAVIEYLGTTHDWQAVKALTDAAGSREFAPTAAVLALAKIDPENEAIKKWVDIFKAQPRPALQVVRTAFVLSSELSETSQTEVAIDLFNTTWRLCRLTPRTSTEFRLQLRSGSGTAPIASDLLIGADGNGSPLVSESLRRYALPPATDLRSFVIWLTPRPEHGRAWGSLRIFGLSLGSNVLPGAPTVRVDLSKGGGIVTAHTGTLNSTVAPDGVELRTSDQTQPNTTLRDALEASWLDTASSKTRSDTVTGFQNSDKLVLSYGVRRLKL